MTTRPPILARWHPANKGDMLSIPKLRVTNSKWGQPWPHVDGASFANMHGEWLVDDDGEAQTVRYPDPRLVIRRLRALGSGGAIQFVEPYVDHEYVEGCPEPFSPAWANLTRDILRKAYRDLRGLLRMSAAEIDTIHWVLDHEQWDVTAYVKADEANKSLQVGRTYSEKPLARPWASQAIEWTVWALREAGFGGPITNHASGVTQMHGRCAQTRHPALSMPHLAGYMNDTNMYTPAEIEEEMEELAAERKPFAYTHHAGNHPRLIDVARKCGARMVLLWN